MVPTGRMKGESRLGDMLSTWTEWWGKKHGARLEFFKIMHEVARSTGFKTEPTVRTLLSRCSFVLIGGASGALHLSELTVGMRVAVQPGAGDAWQTARVSKLSLQEAQIDLGGTALVLPAADVVHRVEQQGASSSTVVTKQAQALSLHVTNSDEAVLLEQLLGRAAAGAQEQRRDIVRHAEGERQAIALAANVVDEMVPKLQIAFAQAQGQRRRAGHVMRVRQTIILDIVDSDGMASAFALAHDIISREREQWVHLLLAVGASHDGPKCKIVDVLKLYTLLEADESLPRGQPGSRALAAAAVFCSGANDVVSRWKGLQTRNYWAALQSARYHQSADPADERAAHGDAVWTQRSTESIVSFAENSATPQLHLPNWIKMTAVAIGETTSFRQFAPSLDVWGTAWTQLEAIAVAISARVVVPSAVQVLLRFRRVEAAFDLLVISPLRKDPTLAPNFHQQSCAFSFDSGRQTIIGPLRRLPKRPVLLTTVFDAAFLQLQLRDVLPLWLTYKGMKHAGSAITTVGQLLHFEQFRGGDVPVQQLKVEATVDVTRGPILDSGALQTLQSFGQSRLPMQRTQLTKALKAAGGWGHRTRKLFDLPLAKLSCGQGAGYAAIDLDSEADNELTWRKINEQWPAQRELAFSLVRHLIQAREARTAAQWEEDEVGDEDGDNEDSDGNGDSDEENNDSESEERNGDSMDSDGEEGERSGGEGSGGEGSGGEGGDGECSGEERGGTEHSRVEHGGSDTTSGSSLSTEMRFLQELEQQTSKVTQLQGLKRSIKSAGGWSTYAKAVLKKPMREVTRGKDGRFRPMNFTARAGETMTWKDIEKGWPEQRQLAFRIARHLQQASEQQSRLALSDSDSDSDGDSEGNGASTSNSNGDNSGRRPAKRARRTCDQQARQGNRVRRKARSTSPSPRKPVAPRPRSGSARPTRASRRVKMRRMCLDGAGAE